MRVTVPGDPKTRPVIVITSNSEKSLPEPFLRRCVYYDIPFPTAALREIVYAQVKGLQDGSGELLREALALFDRLRDRTRIQRPPGTAELLCWIDALLGADLKPADSLRSAIVAALKADAEVLTVQATAAPIMPSLVEMSLSVLVKKAEDRTGALDVIQKWAQP